MGSVVYGYSCVPPTPFALKDWERYDVSHFVDPGLNPTRRGTVQCRFAENKSGFPTIQEDLEKLAGKDELTNAIFLFHSPPYQTRLDRAARTTAARSKRPFGCPCWQHCHQALHRIPSTPGHPARPCARIGQANWILAGEDRHGHSVFQRPTTGPNWQSFFLILQDPNRAIRRLF